MQASLMAVVLSAFDPEGGSVHLRDMDKESEVYKRGTEVARLFTTGVQALAHFPEPIRSLGKATWDVFHHKHVSLTAPIGKDLTWLDPAWVKTLHFAVHVPLRQALVFVPGNWPEMVLENPVLQLGAIVFIGSQAVDFWNGRIGRDSTTKVMERARAYEAEYLRSVGPEAKLDDYQKAILRDFPRFDRRLKYTRKPVTPLE